MAADLYVHVSAAADRNFRSSQWCRRGYVASPAELAAVIRSRPERVSLLVRIESAAEDKTSILGDADDRTIKRVFDLLQEMSLRSRNFSVLNPAFAGWGSAEIEEELFAIGAAAEREYNSRVFAAMMAW